MVKIKVKKYNLALAFINLYGNIHLDKLSVTYIPKLQILNIGKVSENIVLDCKVFLYISRY